MSFLRLATRSTKPLLGVRYFLGNANARPRVAVILSGCGVYDGSEIHEASSVLTHLSRAGAGIRIFAPDISFSSVDHITGAASTLMKRNVLAESARIARGEIHDLANLDVSSFEAAIFPGGFGAAKNLCTFAEKGADCTVNEDVSRVVQEFHAAKKPLGLLCIAPALAAKTLKDHNVCLTLGGEKEEGGRWPYASLVENFKKLAVHEPKDVTEICIDQQNLLVSTPAFMCNAPLYVIHDAIGDLVRAVIGMARP